MRIKSILFILFTFFIDLHIFADNREKSSDDSLTNSINIYSTDYISNISRESKINNFDSTESVLLEANHLANRLSETDKQNKILIQLGHLYFENGYFENAEIYFNDILKNHYKELLPEQLADVKHSLGLNHIRFNNYNKAINLFQEVLLYYEKTDNKAEIARALKDIGVVYYYLGSENLALDNYQKALIIYKEVNDSDGIARSYNNIGMIFKEKGSIALALEYLNKSLEIKKIQENQYGIANTLGNIGDAYMSDNQYNKAISYFNKSLDLWIKLDYLHGVTEVYNYLGEVYIKIGNYDKAIENLIACREISIKNNFKQRLIKNYQLLSEAYYERQDYKNAIQNLKQYNILKDSLYQSLTNQKIDEYITKYQNVKVENELIEQERKIMQQRYQIIATFIILLLLITFLFFIIRQNRSIRKKSKKILNINKELDKRVNQKTSELRISSFSIDIALDTIIWMKRDGKIVYVNNAACLMLGYSKQELMSMSIFNLVEVFSENIWQEYWDQLRKKKSYVIQLYYKTRMGSEIPAEVAFNFQDFEGEEFNFTYSRNITERKLSEEKLKNAKEKAERSDKLKSVFLANMSHEIRTPMNAINGFISLLGDSDINTEQKREITELAKTSGNDLLNIINDIIDISKIEADELTIIKSLNYVNRLFTEFYKHYLKNIDYAQKKNVKLRMEIEPNSDKIAIFTDIYRFKQVMNNLISNAIKFTEKGEVVIGYSQINLGNRKLLRFFVKDTGLGIPKHSQDAIFDRFTQLNDKKIKEYKGTGLGLAISKKLVDLLGGTIGLVSEEGKGSDFYFTLPYQVLDKPDTINIDSHKKMQDDWSDKSILVVEDAESNYYLIENYLKSTKIQISWAKSGKEALDFFNKKKKCNLVLMDIQLPGINGYEITKLIKAHNKTIPVIAQTAYALAGEKELSIKEGCDDYIAKPINKQALIELLYKYLQ